MAEGVREKIGTDYAIATTGFVGPTGGDENYPLGTCFFAVSSKKETICKKIHVKDERLENIQKVAQEAIGYFVEKIVLFEQRTIKD